MPKFLRRTSVRYSKLGARRKKLQKWRSPKGRHNKLRKKMKSVGLFVSLGYGTNKESRGKINGKVPVIVKNVQDLLRIKKDEIAVIGKVGTKKKIEIVKNAKEKKIEIFNTNTERYLKRTSGKEKKKWT